MLCFVLLPVKTLSMPKAEFTTNLHQHCPVVSVGSSSVQIHVYFIKEPDHGLSRVSTVTAQLLTEQSSALLPRGISSIMRHLAHLQCSLQQSATAQE